jgi:hypothetical protein
MTTKQMGFGSGSGAFAAKADALTLLINNIATAVARKILLFIVSLLQPCVGLTLAIAPRLKQ